MLVEMDTGVYDDSEVYTAHDLAADHWWISANYLARIVGGSILWEHVEYRSGPRVLVWRLEVVPCLHAKRRYIDPETRMVLVKG